MDAPRRAEWARARRLKAEGPWTSHDAVETAVAFAIPRGIHATQVWDAIQPQVRKLLLAGEEEAIWLVVAMEGGDHRAVAGAAAAARSVDELGVPCRLRETRSVVLEAKRRFAVKSADSQRRGIVHRIRAEESSG